MSPAYPKGLHFLEPAHIAEPLFGLHAPSLSVSGMALACPLPSKKRFSLVECESWCKSLSAASPSADFHSATYSASSTVCSRGKDKLSCSSYLDLADCRVILKVTTPAIPLSCSPKLLFSLASSTRRTTRTTPWPHILTQLAALTA